MKKTVIAVFAAALILPLTSCKTLQDNFNARKNLSKCKYEFIKIEPKSVSLSGIKLKNVNFDALFRITNTAKTDVAMDRITGTIYLDNNRAATLTHKKFLKIKKETSAVEPISITIPFKSAMKALGHMPKYITFDLMVDMTIIIGKYNVGTSIPIEVKIKKKVPYNTIRKLMLKQAKKSLKSGSYKNIFKKFR